MSILELSFHIHSWAGFDPVTYWTEVQLPTLTPRLFYEKIHSHFPIYSKQPAAAFSFDSFCRNSPAVLQFLLEGSGLEGSRRF